MFIHAETEILETKPNGDVIVFSRIDLSFPFSNRSVVAQMSPPVETDWFGKRAFAIFLINTTHDSKPAGADGLVRATNGGNFKVAVEDDEEPGAKCHVLGLISNNYNGRVPNSSESSISKKASKFFYKLRQSLIEGHQKYFS